MNQKQNAALPSVFLSANRFPVNEDDRTACRILVAELKSRATARRFHLQSCNELAIVEDISALFPRVRALVAQFPNGKRFENIATSMLVEVVAPYTDRWQRWIETDQFHEYDQSHTFRGELNEVRAGLMRVESLLQKTSESREISKEDLVLNSTVFNRAETKLNELATEPISFGLDCQFMPKSLRDVVEKVKKCEREFISKRRRLFKHPEGDNENAAGIAFSGGGIRSATFCLGVSQVLARKGLFPQIDYMSTVSGGGYLGAFMNEESNLLVNGSAGIDGVKELLGTSKEIDTPQVRRIRNNSRYLASGDVLLDVMGFFAGTLKNLIMLLPFVILAAMAITVLRTFDLWQGTWNQASGWTGWWAAWGSVLSAPGFNVQTATLALGTSAALLHLFTFQSVGGRVRPPKRFVKGLSYSALSALVVASIPLLNGLLHSIRSISMIGEWPSIAAGAAASLATIRAICQKLKSARSHIFKLACASAGPLLLLLMLAAVSNHMQKAGFVAYSIALVPLAFFLAWCAPNAGSLHAVYRDKLGVCYFPHSVRRSLKESNHNHTAPYHLINCAVNLHNSENVELRGRNSDFFLFSKYYCGSAATGYVRTGLLQELDRQVNLPTAIATSGAAIAPNMGVQESNHARFLLTLLNLRLGFWIRNVAHTIHAPRNWECARRLTSGIRCFLGEMFGRLREDKDYLYLSDGGHIENLGVYELLRRRCKFIIAVDGECDTEMKFDGLTKLVRYARIDLGTDIQIDLSDLKLDANGRCRSHSALGKIIYTSTSGKKTIGWMLYIKLSLTGNEPQDLIAYRQECLTFPHQSTLDQIFEERQFEAYRKLGEHAAMDLFQIGLRRGASYPKEFDKNGMVPDQESVLLPAWFEGLAINLLPDNDPVFRERVDSLDGFHIGISTGDLRPWEIKELDVDKHAPDDEAASITRELISQGAVVVFGHDWRTDGVMDRTAEFIREDRLLNERVRPSIRNLIPKYADQDSHSSVPADLSRDVVEIEFLNDESMTNLRTRLASECQTCICVAGKRSGFRGAIPGILEEAWRMAQASIKEKSRKHPPIICRYMKGAAEWLAQRLDYEHVEQIQYSPEKQKEDTAHPDLPKTADQLVNEIRVSYDGHSQRKLYEEIRRITDRVKARRKILELLQLLKTESEQDVTILSS